MGKSTRLASRARTSSAVLGNLQLCPSIREWDAVGDGGDKGAMEWGVSGNGTHSYSSTGAKNRPWKSKVEELSNHALCCFLTCSLNVPLHPPGYWKFSPKIEAVPVVQWLGWRQQTIFVPSGGLGHVSRWAVGQGKRNVSPWAHGCISSLRFFMVCESWARSLIKWVRTCSLGFIQPHFKNAAQHLRRCHLCLVFVPLFLFNWFFFSQRGEADISQVCEASLSN